MPERSVAVFDLGGVLIDWNPRYLYRKLFAGDEAAMEHFLAKVCTPGWNAQQDAGRSFAEACAALKLEHPSHGELIDAWFHRHEEMLAGPIPGTVEILADYGLAEFLCTLLATGPQKHFPRRCGNSISCVGFKEPCSRAKYG